MASVETRKNEDVASIVMLATDPAHNARDVVGERDAEAILVVRVSCTATRKASFDSLESRLSTR